MASTSSRIVPTSMKRAQQFDALKRTKTTTALDLAERAMKQVITTYSLGLKLGGTDMRMLYAALKAIEEAQK